MIQVDKGAVRVLGDVPQILAELNCLARSLAASFKRQGADLEEIRRLLLMAVGDGVNASDNIPTNTVVIDMSYHKGEKP